MATKARSRKSPERREPKKLTEKAICDRVGERGFQLGQEYFNQGAIFDCRRQDALLKARCHGRSAAYYLVSARLEGDQIEEARCSCSDGEGGSCKHVAALLLTWLRAPGRFRETEPVGKLLSHRTKAQLIRLIERMLDHDPELESWVELALPKPGKNGAAIDAAACRDRTAGAFQSAGCGAEADRQLSNDLASLKRIGDGHLEGREFEAAAAVYHGILQGFTDEYVAFHDETGSVVSVARQCVEGLASCLPYLEKSPETRQAALRTLFELFNLDVDSGGVGLADEVPDVLCRQTTPKERATAADWVREAMPRGDDVSANWQRRTLGGLLLRLENPDDDQAYLDHCRRFGLTSDLVERLLTLGRLDEALHQIRQSPDHQLPGYADLLVSQGHADLADSLVRERMAEAKNGDRRRHLADWLERFLASRNDWQAVLELALEEFRNRPRLSRYQDVRGYAKKLKRWKTVRPEVMGVARRRCGTAELMRIYLDEGEVLEAAALINSPSYRRKRAGRGWDLVEIEVAKAAEKAHPESAVDIYSRHVRELIADRGRGNFQTASEYLGKVRRLYNTLGRPADWQKLIAAIRRENATLQALHEELDRAGL